MDLSDPHIADFFLNKEIVQADDSQVSSPEFFRLDTARTRRSSEPIPNDQPFVQRALSWNLQKHERYLRAHQQQLLKVDSECTPAPAISNFAKRYNRPDGDISLPERLIEDGYSKRARQELLAAKAAEERLRAELQECTFQPDTSLTGRSRVDGKARTQKRRENYDEPSFRPAVNHLNGNMVRVKEYLKSDVFSRLSVNSSETAEDPRDSMDASTIIKVNASQSHGIEDFIYRQEVFEEKRKLAIENEKLKILSAASSPKISDKSKKLSESAPEFLQRLRISQEKSVRDFEVSQIVMTLR